jgi:hypothetical protein
VLDLSGESGALLQLKLSRIIHLINFYCAPRYVAFFIHTLCVHHCAPKNVFSQGSSSPRMYIGSVATAKVFFRSAPNPDWDKNINK